MVVSTKEPGSIVIVHGIPPTPPGPETVIITDGGGSITVDDGGLSLTVDGTISVDNFPAVYPVNDNGGSLTVDGSVAVTNFPAVQPVDDNGGSLTVDGTVAVSNLPAAYNPTPSSLVVVAQSAVAGTTTATLPAPGVGLFHYITALYVENMASGNQATVAQPLSFTTTNLPGPLTLSIQHDTPRLSGSIGGKYHDFTRPLKSSVANTATTVISPAGAANTIWKVTVFYYTGA